MRSVWCMAAIVVATSAGESRAEGVVQFNRDVRPILAKHCFACHGPDEQSREADLRLDRRDSALTELDSGSRAIVPGRARGSALIERIKSDDPDLRMPPADSHPALSSAQIDLLTQWIDQGADYELHWSLSAPRKGPLPKLSDGDQTESPIDTYVRDRLQQEGLQLSPEADKQALIRRLSLDLTGLPPAPVEVRAFVSDERPDAYERLVERLLASPHYGERMAVAWLDAARYADTHGYHIDSHRELWPWRDWVIQAYNDNLKFDDFTTWQLAGDLLPNSTRQQQVASGFNRNHGINFEGGAIPEEYLVEYVVDRVNTTGTVWMGLTLGCARCHDHKYDPITQAEYFKFFAFFNTIDEQGLDGYRGNAEPILTLPDEAQQKEQARRAAEIKRLEQALEPWSEQLDSQQHQWEYAVAAVQQAADLLSAGSPPAGLLRFEDSGWYLLEPIVEETAAEVIDNDYLAPSDTFDVNQSIQVHGEAKQWAPAPAITDGQAHDFPHERSANYLWRRIAVDSSRQVTLSVGCTDAFKVWLNGKLLVARDSTRPTPERQQEFEVELLPGDNYILAKVVNISWECQFYFALRGEPDRLPQAIAQIISQPGGERSPADTQRLKTFFRENIAAANPFHELRRELLSERRQLEELSGRIVTTMVMREMKAPRKTYRLERGQYDSPQEELAPTTPSVLPSLPSEGPTDRLALARWLTSPSHPLTSRVVVNRLWQMLFGTGIVSTSEDFGTQGAWPSHPQLLDWLAVEFVESGWDIKHMMRLMVHSKTYRQNSAATPGKLALDPHNRLLSRGPRFRLQAEFLRDLALKTGGLLNDKIGGPSIKNYQPPGLWLELAHQNDNSKFTAQEFEQAAGADLYRRGIYTFWKRSVPPPNLVTLDAPNRETCVVRRETTNTPLQALVLLNDPTFVEASRCLAERMIKGTPSSEQPVASRQDEATQLRATSRPAVGTSHDRARWGFLLATSREPTERELNIILQRYQLHLADFQSDRDSAEQLLSVGESPRDHAIAPAEHAAWTCVAAMLLNLDETMTKE